MLWPSVSPNFYAIKNSWQELKFSTNFRVPKIKQGLQHIGIKEKKSIPADPYSNLIETIKKFTESGKNDRLR